MGSPYVGEVRLVGFNFPPVGWAQCQGQLLPISGNEALYNLIGTTYGGNGQTDFALPNLASRVPVHTGNGYVIGQVAGTETVTLTVNQYPRHTHAAAAAASPQGTFTDPTNNIPCSGQEIYATTAPADGMNSGMISPSNGGNLPHNNLQPFLALNWIISLFGIYPSQ
jgi:microcystin-dependent protein